MTHEPAPEPQPPREGAPPLLRVDDLRGEDDQNGCLRPLGLCELGGCCDVCWYGNHFKRREP